jgi:hypothetical protein
VRMLSDWSLRSLFDRSIPRACAVATSSEVRVVLPSSSEGGGYALTPEPWVSADAGIALYDLTNGKRVFVSRCGSAHTRPEAPLSLISP